MKTYSGGLSPTQATFADILYDFISEQTGESREKIAREYHIVDDFANSESIIVLTVIVTHAKSIEVVTPDESTKKKYYYYHIIDDTITEGAMT